MKRLTLEVLCCPNCQGELSLRDEKNTGMVNEGDLFCARCERSFLIRNGIAHFIYPEELEGLNRRFARFYERFSRFEVIFDKLSFLPMGGERKARAEILRRLELSGGRVLEVSIGSGGNLPFLFESAKMGEAYGLDISAAQLTRCQKRVEHVGGINFFSEKKKAINEMIRVARPGSKIVIADESERAAQITARLLRLSRSNQGRRVDTSIPVHLVPETMEEIRVDGIWKMHGQYHGYCLEFRKPAG